MLANAADNLAGSSAVPHDTPERLPDFVETRRFCAEPTQARIGVGDDRGNRLIDFVRDRGGHLPQQHDPIEAREIGLGLLQSLLRTFAIGDVDDNCTKESWRAVCRGNDKRSDVGPYDLAVLASVTLALQKPDSTAVNTLLHRGPIVLVSKLQRREISQLRLGIAGHPLKTLVHRHIPSALKIKGCDADRGDLEHGSPTLLARA